MKLSQKAIDLLQADPQRKRMLAVALNFTEYWTGQLIEKNKPNGPMTTVTAVKKICEITGLDQSEVLEETVAENVIEQQS